jgi:hypothetical protein
MLLLGPFGANALPVKNEAKILTLSSSLSNRLTVKHYA